MSRHGRYLEASAHSIGLSNAVRLQQAQHIEGAIPLHTSTSFDNASDTISKAIFWELGRTFNTSATREVVLNDKCERFALKLSEDEMPDDQEPMILLPAMMSAIEEHEPIANSHTPKRAQRSLHQKKRSYTWKQPLKNQGSRIRKRLLEANLANTMAKASMKLTTSRPKKINTLSEHSINILQDNFIVDEVFQDTRLKQKIFIVMDSDTYSEDEGGTAEDDDDLFLPKPKNVRAIPPSTTRQLVSLIRKKMGELYELVAIKLGGAESVAGLELAERIKGAVDKVKLDKVGDLSVADIVALHEALSLLEEDQLAMDF